MARPTFFKSAAEFRAWLEKHHANDELVLGFFNASSGKGGITHKEALDEALCYGWIDGVVKNLTPGSYTIRFSPRRPGSHWSRINVAAVEELIAQGRMRPSGLAAFEARREDRTGTYSFEQGDLGLTPEQEAVLRADPAAAAFWDAATPGYRKVVVHWLGDARQAATRERRLAQLVEDCAAGRLVKFQRYGTEPAWVARAAVAAKAARRGE